MPHYNQDNYSSSTLSDDSSLEGFVMSYYNREDNSSVSSEEDYSISKEEPNHSTIDTTLISTISDAGDSFVHDVSLSNVSLSDMSAELSCEGKIDLEVLSRMVGPVTEQNGKRTKKNEEMRRQKVSVLYNLLGRPDPTKWNGKKGTIQYICDALKLSPRKSFNRSIQNVLKKCNLLQKDEVYDPTRKEHVHRKEILTKDQKQHLADTVEKNYASICDATEDIHNMRTEKGQNTVSVSTVWRKMCKIPH